MERVIIINLRINTKLVCFLLIIVLTFSLFGCGDDPSTTVPKHTLPAPSTKDDAYTTFTTEFYQITLPKDFRQAEPVNGRTGFTNDHVHILFGYEPFTVHPSLPDLPIEEYGQKMIALYNLDTKLQNFGGVLWFEYAVQNPQYDGMLSYLVTLYKTNSASWCIEYCCDSRDMKNHREAF